VSALGVYASLALICASSAIVGHGLRTALSDREWSWISPALGLAALLVVGGLAIRLPGRATTAAVVLAAIVLAALALLWRRGLRAPGAAGPGVAVLAAVVVAASVPFAAAGAFGVLGPDVNQDIVTHEVNAEWLRSHEGPEPPQVESGYPIGPHGLAATVSELTGAGLVESFTAILIAAAVAAALASLAALRDLPAGRRTLACLLVGLPYLAASFYVQSAFKEALMGMLVLAFALELRRAVGEDRVRGRAAGGSALARGIPLGLLAVAAVQTYSYAGLAWLAATAGLWALAAVAVGDPAGRGSRWSRPSSLLPAAAVAIAALALAALADLSRVLDFLGSEESGFAGTAVANLVDPVPPWEALGVWLRTDYRYEPSDVYVLDAWVAIGLLALAVGVVQLARRRELALLAGVASVAMGYAASRLLFGIYTQSKALAIAAPLVMLASLYGLLAPAPWLRGEAARIARGALAVVFVAGALASSYFALAGAKVHRNEGTDALSDLRPGLDGNKVLFLGSDLFAGSELYGLLFQRTPEGALEERGEEPSARLDFDTFVPAVLDTADYVITGRTPFTSEPPPNFHRVRTAGPFVLWERDGPTPERRTFDETQAPGAVLDCATPEGRRIAGRDGVARVFDPAPVQAPSSAWADADGNPVFFPQVDDGRTVGQALELTPGRWVISLQYMSPEPLDVTAPGLDAEAPPRLETVGAFWPVGTLEVTEASAVPFSVRVAPRPPLRRAIAAPPPDPAAALGGIVATRVGTGRRTVPLGEACGELVDWYRPG
jgi:hypothetical protein